MDHDGCSSMENELFFSRFCDILQYMDVPVMDMNWGTFSCKVICNAFAFYIFPFLFFSHFWGTFFHFSMLATTASHLSLSWNSVTRYRKLLDTVAHCSKISKYNATSDTVWVLVYSCVIVFIYKWRNSNPYDLKQKVSVTRLKKGFSVNRSISCYVIQYSIMWKY